MIVLKANFVPEPSEFTGPLIVIEAAEDGYKITRINSAAGPALNIKVTDVEPWGRVLYYWSAYGDGFVAASNYENSRDYDAFMRSRFGCPEGPVLVAARGGSGELALVVTAPMHTALPYQAHGYGPSAYAVDTVIPGYSQSARAKSNKAKRDLLEQISPLDLLAEQEKQVDLLSMLVIDLAEKQPQSERPDWLPGFKAAVAQHSAVQFKGPQGAIADIVERKARMRELQRAYFTERDV